MSDFNKAINIILELEGGYVSNPNDRGHITKWGISQTAYPNIDIANLTIDQAKSIYLVGYWMKAKCELLPQRLATYYFSATVNMGCMEAIKLLQAHMHLTPDGIIGKVTESTMALTSPDYDYQFLTLCALHYIRLLSADSFLPGWLSRLFRVSQLT
jgi:lysozyme family protein